MRRLSVVTVLLACALLAACGGDDGGGSTAKAPSQDEYAAAADRLCVSLDKRVQEVTSRRPQSVADLRGFVDRLEAVVDDAVRRFEALPPPEGEAGRAARAYVAALRAAIEDKLKPALERIRQAVARRDVQGIQAAGRDIQALDSARLKRLARAAGAAQCAT
jgi:hypothetical protein